MTEKRKAQFSHGNSKKARTEDQNSTKSNHKAIHNDVPRLNSTHPTHKPITKNNVPRLPPITPELEKAVFTHQSLSGGNSHTQELSYERLEFLGDAYIEVMATRLIWDQYKALPAGRMSQTRELLVKNETLYDYALRYDFNKRIKVQRHFEREDPKKWLKIVADVFEAYVAAIILSEPTNGFVLAEEWLTQLWLPKLKEVPATGPNSKAKEQLAQKIMGKGVKLHYRDEAPMEQLKGGMQTYFIGVYLTGWGWEDQHLGSGTGLSKGGAGNEAAAKALGNMSLIDEIVAKRKSILDKEKLEKPELVQAAQVDKKSADKNLVPKPHD